jgi:hypothetical protein
MFTNERLVAGFIISREPKESAYIESAFSFERLFLSFPLKFFLCGGRYGHSYRWKMVSVNTLRPVRIAWSILVQEPFL